MTSWPAPSQTSDVLREALEPGTIEPPLVGVDEQRRADFDDHALGVDQAAGLAFAVCHIHVYAILPFT